MPDITPAIAFPNRKDEGSEKGTRFLGSREARDHNFLTLRGFDLEPVIRADARQIFAAGAFCHDAFKSLARRFLEEFRAKRLAVPAEGNKPVFGKGVLQALLALNQRQRAQVLAILKHEVEDAVEK